MTIEQYAFTLLITHLASMVFIFNVLKRQWRLMKQPIPSYVKRYRYTLFILSLVIFAGNIVPIIIDALTLFIEVGRPDTVKLVSLLYAYSNAITAVVSAYLIWTLYRLAADTKTVTDFET
jgi:uncharacterized BrkB/YihY/UPF0761 family membrane protein